MPTEMLKHLLDAEVAEARCRDLSDAIEAAMGASVIVHFEQRYNGEAHTACVDDNFAQVRRGFDASTKEAALSGLLKSLTELYPNRFAPAFAVAAA